MCCGSSGDAIFWGAVQQETLLHDYRLYYYAVRLLKGFYSCRHVYSTSLGAPFLRGPSRPRVKLPNTISTGHL